MRLGGQNREILPEIEAAAQLRYRALPRDDARHRRGLAKPVGQRFLAGLGPRGVEQLEQRAGPEEVEIPGVGMALEKTRTVRSAARPAALDPVHAAKVEPPRACRTIVLVQHL